MGQLGTTFIEDFYCVYGEFGPLYTCLRTLREQYRSQNCDNGGITTIHKWSSEVWTSQLWNKPSGGRGTDLWQCVLMGTL